MAEQKNTYTLPIAGTMLNIRTTDSEEYVRRLAAQLDDKMLELVRGAAKCTRMDAALLCALELADEKVKNVEVLRQVEKELMESAEEIALLRQKIRSLEDALSQAIRALDEGEHRA